MHFPNRKCLQQSMTAAEILQICAQRPSKYAHRCIPCLPTTLRLHGLLWQYQLLGVQNHVNDYIMRKPSIPVLYTCMASTRSPRLACQFA